MKIKGWEKINGFTYKGFCIVNPMHNAQETKYEATILNLNLPQKPKWELSVLTPQHKFIVGENTADGIFFISMWDDNKFSASRKMNKQMMKSISNFRQTFEEMVDEILKIQLTSAPSNSLSSGIINQVQNASTNFLYGSSSISVTNIQSNALQTLQQLTK
jgi:hypothetical protein